MEAREQPSHPLHHLFDHAREARQEFLAPELASPGPARGGAEPTGEQDRLGQGSAVSDDAWNPFTPGRTWSA